MSDKTTTILKPAAWLFYLVIGMEILYMISPFAIYYYSTYGPGLNSLHASAETAWLSGFFLPHFVKTSSFILNSYHIVGWALVGIGFLLFLIGAGQIYYHKFARKGAVTGGLYRVIRHPQYVAFAIMGFGLLLAWPRFTVLIMFVTMLFVYYWLAKREEDECVQKFGDSYKAYQARTSMFVPGNAFIKNVRIPMPESRFTRLGIGFLTYALTLAIALAFAFLLRDYSLSKISAYYSGNSATISAAYLPKSELKRIVDIAVKDPRVSQRLKGARNGSAQPYLNYVVPTEWYLADIPMENIPDEIHGHHQPGDYDRTRYKVLLTKAKLRITTPVVGAEIIKQTYGRQPIVLAYVDAALGQVTEVGTPPEHVRWGDIPTPLF